MDNMTDYIAENYNYFIYEQMDPRVKDWIFLGSPFPIITVLFTYLLFVKWLGPLWMKDRPAYNVEKPMLLYNIVQMIINAQFVYEAMTHVWIPGNYNVICQKINYEPSPLEDIIVGNFYRFFWSRLLDLLDTVFMVLKKNNHQITFLHVYHHMLVGASCWMVAKYLPGGNIAFFGTINSFVHTVMYFYYFLTAYDASYKKSIWWKKHITELQLIQFVIVIIQQTLAVFSSSCGYPRFMLVFFLTQMSVMLYLFTRFYITAYIQKKKAK